MKNIHYDNKPRTITVGKATVHIKDPIKHLNTSYDKFGLAEEVIFEALLLEAFGWLDTKIEVMLLRDVANLFICFRHFCDNDKALMDLFYEVPSIKIIKNLVK